MITPRLSSSLLEYLVISFCDVIEQLTGVEAGCLVISNYTYLKGASVLCYKISDTGWKRLRKWLNNFVWNHLPAYNE